MKKAGNFQRGPEAYARRPPRFAPSGKAFLIVTEGEKTEKNYLEAVRSRLKLAPTAVRVVHPPGTDPVTLVNAAIQWRDEQRAVVRQSVGAVAYDEVWVVFDLEKTHDQRRKLAAEAKVTAEAEEVKFAVSDPCFEYWLLIHAEDTAGAFKDCAAVIRRLKKHWPGYAKGQPPPPEFLARLPKAVERAGLRRKHLAALGEAQHPFTDVDLLVGELNASGPHRLFAL